MSIYGTTQEQARAVAADLTACRVGLPATLTDNPGGVVTAYLVKPYTWSDTFRKWNEPVGKVTPTAWGVIERWRYADRPDLPEMGGAFVRLDDARRLIANIMAQPSVGLCNLPSMS